MMNVWERGDSRACYVRCEESLCSCGLLARPTTRLIHNLAMNTRNRWDSRRVSWRTTERAESDSGPCEAVKITITWGLTNLFHFMHIQSPSFYIYMNRRQHDLIRSRTSNRCPWMKDWPLVQILAKFGAKRVNQCFSHQNDSCCNFLPRISSRVIIQIT